MFEDPHARSSDLLEDPRRPSCDKTYILSFNLSFFKKFFKDFSIEIKLKLNSISWFFLWNFVYFLFPYKFLVYFWCNLKQNFLTLEKSLFGNVSIQSIVLEFKVGKNHYTRLEENKRRTLWTRKRKQFSTGSQKHSS